MIVYCKKCKSHPYQDKKYGKNKRVHNKGKAVGVQHKYRCTVCLNEQNK